MKLDLDRVLPIVIILALLAVPAFINIPFLTPHYQTVISHLVQHGGIYGAIAVILALFIPRFAEMGAITEFIESGLGLVLTVLVIVMLPMFFNIPYITPLYQSGVGIIFGFTTSILTALGIKARS